MSNHGHHGNGGEASKDAQNKIKQLVDEATDKGRELLNEGIENAKELLEERAADLKKRAEAYGLDEAADTVKSYVKKNPWRSVAVAVVAGLVLGKIFSSSDEEQQ